MIWTHFEIFFNETKCSNKFVIPSMVRQWWQYYNYIHLFWKNKIQKHLLWHLKQDNQISKCNWQIGKQHNHNQTTHKRQMICKHIVTTLHLWTINETMPIINKPKHPKKRGIQGTKKQDLYLKRQKSHLRRWTTRGTSSSWTSSCHEKHIK